MPYLILQRKIGFTPLAQVLGGSITKIGNGLLGENATIFFNNDGTVAGNGGSVTVPNPLDDWFIAGITPSIGDDYEIKATLISGSALASGTMDTWITISGLSSSWNLQQPTIGTKTATVEFSIRLISTGQIHGTGQYTLTATKSS